MLILVIGDFYVPIKAPEIPAKFRSLLVPGKIDMVLSTGNLCSREVHDYLRSLSHDLHVVRGELDMYVSGLPEHTVVRAGAFTLGVIHGHQLLPAGDVEAAAAFQRQLNCDVLITGGHPSFRGHRYEDRFIISPGSATGSTSGETAPVSAAASTLSGQAQPAAADDAAGAPNSNGAGAGAAGGAAPNPSFVLLDIDGARCTTYCYELAGGEMKVEKMSFVKPL